MGKKNATEKRAATAAPSPADEILEMVALAIWRGEPVRDDLRLPLVNALRRTVSSGKADQFLRGPVPKRKPHQLGPLAPLFEELLLAQERKRKAPAGQMRGDAVNRVFRNVAKLMNPRMSDDELDTEAERLKKDEQRRNAKRKGQS